MNIKLITCINGLKNFRKFFKEATIRVRARDRILYIMKKAM